MEEIWKDIEGYEGLYQVSNFGRVKSLNIIKFNQFSSYKHKGRVLKLQLNKQTGYMYVNLSKLKSYKTTSIHRLVAKAFIPNPENKSQVNHKDGNKFNNYVENLEWCTQIENSFHAYQNGLNKLSPLHFKGEEHQRCKLSNKDILNIRSRINYGYGFYAELAREYGVTKENIESIYNRRTWKHI